MVYYWHFHWLVLFPLLLWMCQRYFIFLPIVSANVMSLFILHACCATIAPHGDQLLLMNNPRPCSFWNMSQVLGQWSPVALFRSCWYRFHFWLGKCHSQTTTKSLPKGFNTDEPCCMCLLKKWSDPWHFVRAWFPHHFRVVYVTYDQWILMCVENA